MDTFAPARGRAIALLCLLPFVVPPLLEGYDQPQSAAAPSSNQLKDLSLEQLSQIEVTTPSKAPQRAFQTPAAIYVITGEDIRRSGVTTVPEALRLAPGVEVARIDANKWAIGIRGFGSRLSRSVLVMIDGRTVYTTLFAGTYWEVQDTMLEDIDRIEVIRGPGGTIWGPNAIDGVVNIITKPPDQTRGMLASAGGGNEDQAFTDFRYGARNGNDLDYRVYGKAYTRGPEYHQDGRNFDDWRGGQAGFRLQWAANARDTFTLQGDTYHILGGESVSATSYAPPYSQILDGNARLSGGDVMAVWQRKLDNGGDLLLQVYYDRTNRWEPNLADLRNTYDVDFVEHLPAGERHRITWGLSARAVEIDNPVVVTGLQFLPTRRTDQLYTAFLQDEFAIVQKRLHLIAGTKLLRTNFTSFEFEPSLRLLWTPSDRETVWAAFTHAVRTPSDAEEDFYLVGNAGTTINGLPLLARFNANLNFAPEQMNGWELGYRRLVGKTFAFGVSSFYNHYHDLFDEEFTGGILLEDDPPPAHYLLPAQFGNGLRGYTKGVEIVPEWRPAERWRLRGSYSFLHMNVGRAPHSLDIGTAPGIVGSSPQHQAWVQSSVDISKTFQVDLTYRYVSALPAESVPAYSTADARLGWRLGRELDLSLVGRNLLQPYHFESNGNPGPLVGISRSAYLMLTWTR